MRYDLILLDADDTLYDFGAAASAAFAAFAAALPAIAAAGWSAADLYPRYLEINEAIWRELERGEIDKESLKTERFRRLFAAAGVAADPEAASRLFLDRLAEQAIMLDGAADFVRALKASGARLAIASNGIASVQRGRFVRSPLAGLIDELCISGELGAEKPAREFFAAAFRRLGRTESAKAGVAMVGDSWSADVEGALGFGLDAVWFNPARKPLPGLPAGLAGAAGRLAVAADYPAALAALGL